MICSVLVDRIAVFIGLDEPCPCGDRVLLPACHWISDAAHLDLGNVVGSGLAGDWVLVVIDDKHGIRGVHIAETTLAVLIVIAIAHIPAQRLTDILRMLLIIVRGIPAEHCVRRGNNVAIAQFLCVQSLL